MILHRFVVRKEIEFMALANGYLVRISIQHGLSKTAHNYFGSPADLESERQ